MRLLHAPRGRRALPGGLGGQLLPRRFPAGGLPSRLLGTGHTGRSGPAQGEKAAVGSGKRPLTGLRGGRLRPRPRGEQRAEEETPERRTRRRAGRREPPGASMASPGQQRRRLLRLQLPEAFAPRHAPLRRLAGGAQPMGSHAANSGAGLRNLPVKTDAPLGLSPPSLPANQRRRPPQPTNGLPQAEGGTRGEQPLLRRPRHRPPPHAHSPLPPPRAAVTGHRPRRRYLACRASGGAEAVRGPAATLVARSRSLPAFPDRKWRAPGGGCLPVMHRAGGGRLR